MSVGGSDMNSKLTEGQRNMLEALAEEYADRNRRGEEVSIEEYIKRHPELEGDKEKLRLTA